MREEHKDFSWKLNETGYPVGPRYELFFIHIFQNRGRFQFMDDRVLPEGVPTFSGESTWEEVLKIARNHGLILHLNPGWNKTYSYPYGTVEYETVEERIQRELEHETDPTPKE